MCAPYLSSSSAKTASTSTPQLYTTYTYDALNRKTSVTNSVGTTYYTYKNWTTTVTDPNGKQKDYIYDDLPQETRSVFEARYGFIARGTFVRVIIGAKNILRLSGKIQ